MTFRDQLNEVNDLGISICELEVANECDCIFNFEYTDEEFEELCSFALYCYLKDCSGQIAPMHIARAIQELIVEDKKTVDEVISMNKWDMLEKASYQL